MSTAPSQQTTATSTVMDATSSPVSVWGLDVDAGRDRHGLSLVSPHGGDRKSPTYRSDSVVEMVVDQMRELRTRGQLNAHTRGELARLHDVTDRTLRNWLTAADTRDAAAHDAAAAAAAGETVQHVELPPVGEPRLVLSADDINARAGFSTDMKWYLWWLGKAMATNEAASLKYGEECTLIPLKHRTTVIRALNRQAPASLVAGLRGGSKQVAAASARFEVDHQFADTWQGDATYLPVLCRLRSNGRAFQPILVAFREPVSGRIMAWALLPERPNAAMIAAIVGQGLLTTQLPDGTPVPPPRQVRLDNAGEHAGEELSSLLAGVGITISLNTDSYASWQNGCIERFWALLKADAITGVPGARNLGLTRTGEHYTLPNGQAVAFDDLNAHLARHIDYFNTEEHSGARDGRVPEQVWADELAALTALPGRRMRRTPKPDQVATLALAPTGARGARQVVHPLGVAVGKKYLTGHAITDHVGRDVSVHRWPNPSLATAEVYDPTGRTYLGRVQAHNRIDEDARSAVRCQERNVGDRVEAAMHRAKHLYAAEFTRLAGPTPVDTTPFAAGEAAGWVPGETIEESDAHARATTGKSAAAGPDGSDADAADHDVATATRQADKRVVSRGAQARLPEPGTAMALGERAGSWQPTSGADLADIADWLMETAGDEDAQ